MTRNGLEFAPLATWISTVRTHSRLIHRVVFGLAIRAMGWSLNCTLPSGSWNRMRTKIGLKACSRKSYLLQELSPRDPKPSLDAQDRWLLQINSAEKEEEYP